MNKKSALTALQIVVTLGILFLVFRDPVKRAEMARALGNADRAWLFAGLASYGVVELLAAIRWQLLLRVQGIALGSFRVFQLVMIGIFFNFFIPGGTGGDVVKIFYLLKETPGQSSGALLSVLVDRLVGLLALILMSGVFIAARWDWLVSTSETAKAVWTALAILGFSVLGIGTSFVLTGFGLIHKLPARLPGRDKLAEFALAYNLYGRAWKPTLLAVLISFGAHFGYFATFYCAAKAFHTGGGAIPTFAELCAILPVINTITAMPVSLGGLGVREGLFQVFLVPLCGVSSAVAVIMSSTGYFLTLTWGLVGGALYLFYRPSEHARLREMKREVAAFEHAVAEKEIALETAREIDRR